MKALLQSAARIFTTRNTKSSDPQLRLAQVLYNEIIPLFDGRAPYRLMVLDYVRAREIKFFGDFEDPLKVEDMAPEAIKAEINRAIRKFITENHLDSPERTVATYGDDIPIHSLKPA